jgi:allose kinase
MTKDLKEFVLGMDIGGTHLRLGRVTRDGELDNFIIKSINGIKQSSDPIGGLKETITDYLQTCEGKLLAISIGFPAIISRDKKIILSSPNIPAFNDLNVADPLQNEFQVPIFMDNDVNFLLLKEIVDRQLPNSGVVVGFYIGTGFGNSIYIDGKFLDGKNGVAAELGHIPVLAKDEICACGNPGCIEIYASGIRLQAIKKEHFPGCEIQDIFVHHKSSDIIQKYLNALAIPIATEINILDPDNIIIGGGVVNMDSFPKEDLETYIYLHARKPYPADNLTISYANANQTLGVVGAAYHALRKINEGSLGLSR